MMTAEATAHEHVLEAEGRGSPQDEGPADSSRTHQNGTMVADQGTAPAERAIAFGPFRLLPMRRLLLVARYCWCRGDRPALGATPRPGP
jgi:hypothetical protein